MLGIYCDKCHKKTKHDVIDHFTAKCTECGHYKVDHVNKAIFFEQQKKKEIKEFGNVVTVVGHNLPDGIIRGMMDAVTDNYLETMKANNLPLHQEIKVRIYEEMRADEYQVSPEVIPYTSIMWKVEVDK